MTNDAGEGRGIFHELPSPPAPLPSDSPSRSALAEQGGRGWPPRPGLRRAEAASAAQAGEGIFNQFMVREQARKEQEAFHELPLPIPLLHSEWRRRCPKGGRGGASGSWSRFTSQLERCCLNTVSPAGCQRAVGHRNAPCQPLWFFRREPIDQKPEFSRNPIALQS